MFPPLVAPSVGCSRSPMENMPAVTTARLEKAATGFAALFLEQMLETMAPSMFGHGAGAGDYQSLYLDALSRNIAREGGMGLLPMIEKALGVEGKNIPKVASATVVMPVVRDVISGKAGGLSFSGAQTFVGRILRNVEAAGRALGISPRLIVAQAALETGWGAHIAGNNLFGIKAGEDWTGQVTDAPTREFQDGIRQSFDAAFRAYHSLEASIQDYVGLIRDRFPQILGVGGDAAAFAAGLARGGYATDPAYAQKLAEIADSPLLRALVP